MSDIDLLSRILDSLPVLIGLVNSDQRYEFVNAAYVAQFNMPKEKIIGMSVSELNGTAAYERHRDQIEAALTGKNVEFEYHLDDRYYRINYLPRWKQETVTGYFVIATDITQLKKTTLELEKSLLELRSTQSSFENFANFAHFDRIASVGAMAIGLAHDISQPISSINILVDALRVIIKDDPTNPKANTMMSDIQHQVQFAADIINRLRRFSSNQSAKRKVTEVNAVLDDALAMMKPRLLANNVQLRVKKSAEECFSKIDGVEVQQVIVNLLANAIDSVSAMEDRHRMIEVVTDIDPYRNYVCQIIDNGPGVSPDMIDRLFTAFESDKESGSGIGLAISHKLIEQNGGSLELERSEFNESGHRETVFVCKLPLLDQRYCRKP